MIDIGHLSGLGREADISSFGWSADYCMTGVRISYRMNMQLYGNEG